MRKRLLVLSCFVLLAVLLSSCVVQPIQPVAGAPEAAAEAPEGTLVSVPVDVAPSLDGVGDDEVWSSAAPLTVHVSRGENMKETDVSVQSVYSGDSVYFLMSWADPTQSFIRSPWVKQDDGSWAKLTDPNDKGGDNNVYYEDKVAVIWPINNSIPDFQNQGCFVACHKSDEGDPKPYGNKYTEAEGQTGDIWHWKSVRNLGQIDDQYLDSVQYSADTPEAGRHSDPKDSGGYADNQTEDKTAPMWMGPEGAPRDGAPGYILDSEKLPFDDALFAPGDMIPSIVKSAIVGDRGDITAAWMYADGTWTIEFGRKLDTGSEVDVQFSDLAQPYSFAVAIFDNAQVRHAFQNRSNTLVFQQ